MSKRMWVVGLTSARDGALWGGGCIGNVEGAVGCFLVSVSILREDER